MTSTGKLDQLAELVAKTDKKITLTMEVSSGGNQTFKLERVVKGGKIEPIVTTHSAHRSIYNLDDMADETLLALAAKGLGLEDQF